LLLVPLLLPLVPLLLPLVPLLLVGVDNTLELWPDPVGVVGAGTGAG